MLQGRGAGVTLIARESDVQGNEADIMTHRR